MEANRWHYFQIFTYSIMLCIENKNITNNCTFLYCTLFSHWSALNTRFLRLSNLVDFFSRFHKFHFCFTQILQLMKKKKKKTKVGRALVHALDFMIYIHRFWVGFVNIVKGSLEGSEVLTRKMFAMASTFTVLLLMSAGLFKTTTGKLVILIVWFTDDFLQNTKIIETVFEVS